MSESAKGKFRCARRSLPAARRAEKMREHLRAAASFSAEFAGAFAPAFAFASAASFPASFDVPFAGAFALAFAPAFPGDDGRGTRGGNSRPAAVGYAHSANAFKALRPRAPRAKNGRICARRAPFVQPLCAAQFGCAIRRSLRANDFFR